MEQELKEFLSSMSPKWTYNSCSIYCPIFMNPNGGFYWNTGIPFSKEDVIKSAMEDIENWGKKTTYDDEYVYITESFGVVKIERK